MPDKGDRLWDKMGFWEDKNMILKGESGECLNTGGAPHYYNTLIAPYSLLASIGFSPPGCVFFLYLRLK